MAKLNSHKLPDNVLEYFEEMTGQICCIQNIRNDRSFNLGFGEISRHKSIISEVDRGKWEIGTYCCSWRVIYKNKIFCASQDSVDSIDELRCRIREIEWGRFSAIRQPTDLDVRVEFDNGVFVDFLATISDEDEVVHVFLPNKVVIKFLAVEGWIMGPSDKPWNKSV